MNHEIRLSILSKTHKKYAKINNQKMRLRKNEI